MAFDKASPLVPNYQEFTDPTGLDISGQVVWMVSVLDYDDKVVAEDFARSLPDAMFILQELQKFPRRWSVNSEYCAVSYYSFKLEPFPVESFEWYSTLDHFLEDGENVLDRIPTPSEALAYLLQQMKED